MHDFPFRAPRPLKASDSVSEFDCGVVSLWSALKIIATAANRTHIRTFSNWMLLGGRTLSRFTESESNQGHSIERPLCHARRLVDY